MDKRLGDHKTRAATGRPLRSGAASPFVGRDEELQRLTTALSLASEGQGGIAFITGQPGIGKTRLAREALALARGRGFTVLEGRAYPLEIGLAYAPVVDAFGPLLRCYDPYRLEILLSGLPSLGRIFEGLPLPSPEPLNDAALEKTRLFEAVSRLLERLADEAPVALFVDDLHWADPATLELLHYLARGLADRRALLLATYGESTLDAPRGLRALVGSLQRDCRAQEIVLKPLRQEAVEKLVQGILDGEAPESVVALLDTRAGGTPLFVEALIGALVDSGNLVRAPSQGSESWVLHAEGAEDLPQNVRRLILERLDRLAPSERRVLDFIAVLGDAASHKVLRAAIGLEEEPLLDALRRLRAAGLVADGMDGLDVTYGITHPLVQEVAYAELPEMERRGAHKAATKALESLSAGQQRDARRLARHYRGAGLEADPEGALAALTAAGERALHLYANEEAARHFEAALSLLRRSQGARVGGEGTVSRPPIPDPQLLEWLGEAWERIGKPEAAIEAWNEALAERERAGDALGAARLRRSLALAEWDRGHIDIANAHLKAGLIHLTEAMAGQAPSQELADLHFARYHILVRLGDTAGAGKTAEQLLSIAKSLASPRAEAEANLAATHVLRWQGDVNGSRERATHALMIAEQARDLAMCCQAHAALAGSCLAVGEHHLMRYHAEMGLASARRLGAPSVEVVFHTRLAYADFLSGAWSESLRHSQEAVALARRVGYTRALAHALAERAMFLAIKGDLFEAEACLSEVKMALGNPSAEGPSDLAVFGLVEIVEMALAIQRGQVERALSIGRSFAKVENEGWKVEWEDPSAVNPQPWALTHAFMPLGLPLLAEAQIAVRDPDSALRTARQIVGLGPPGTPYLDALASRVEGLARQALGQHAVAADCLARAHERFASLSMQFEAARALLEQATAALQARSMRQETGARAAEQSLAIFERLDAQPYAERARRLLRSLGISPRAAHRLRLGGVAVSERELEIARLVAQGLTNPEIAKRLTLSPFTVTAHLHRLYTRLGVDTRGALARLVIEAGLLLP